jgi:hypothetical protein
MSTPFAIGKYVAISEGVLPSRTVLLRPLFKGKRQFGCELYQAPSAFLRRRLGCSI